MPIHDGMTILLEAWIGIAFVGLLVVSLLWSHQQRQRTNPLYFRTPSPPSPRRSRRKPPWVRQRIIQFKANDPTLSIRQLAACFNRQFGHRETVSATFVWQVITQHRAEIARLRTQVRQRQHQPTPAHRTWGIDLTGKGDQQRTRHTLLGIIDHGPRACLCLQALKDKASITLLRTLLIVIERYGKPRALRTDNEACFTSRWFRFGLWWLGIRHQRTDLHCPWQNGRIERLFGTLKQKLDPLTVVNHEGLAQALAEFRFWYNFVRPHQHLGYRTPAEVWERRWAKPRAIPYSAWDGLLTGFYHPRE